MFQRFREGAIKAIMYAQEFSRCTQNNFVGPESLLAGLAAVEQGKVALALKELGVTKEQVRSEFKRVVGIGTDDVAIEIPFTFDSKRLLESSWDEARMLGDNFIDTQHLLLGLLSYAKARAETKPEPLKAMQMLEGLNVAPDELRQRVLDLASAK